MEFSSLIQRAMDIRQRYAEWEQQTYGRRWTEEEIALGMVGDVGDLAKLILAHNGVRRIPDAEQKLAHELSDCLWSIIVLAQSAGVDLESAFLHTMDELEHHLTAGQ
jgi:NTP pyrophosphatase (non-canonical NTP hydrolase)